LPSGREDARPAAATHIVSKDPDLRNLKHYRGARVLDPAAFLAAWRIHAGR